MTWTRILCIDDSEADQFLAKYHVEKAAPGVEFRMAFDGQEGLAVLQEEGWRPDLILLDINMPRMDGFQFLEALAAMPDAPAAPLIVMLTSSQLAKDRERAMASSLVRGYLEKPLGADWRDQVSSVLAGA